MAHVVVDAGSIRPVSLCCHDIKALVFDQPLGDACPHAVEFRRPVAGFAKQNHTCVPNPLQERFQVGVLQVDKSLCMFRNESWHRDTDGWPGLHHSRRSCLPIGIFALPALLADQGNEPDVGKIFLFEFILIDTRDTNQLLCPRVATDRYHHASANSQLMQQTLGNVRSTGRHQDGIERRLILPAFRAIRVTNVHIVIASIRQVAGRSFGELPDAFNGENLTRDFGQDCRGVTRAATDLQDLFAAAQGKGFDHEGHDVGLGDRLTGPNR